MRRNDFFCQRVQAWKLLLHILVVLRDDVSGQTFKRRLAPVRQRRAGLRGGICQRGEHGADFDVLFGTGNGERLSPSTTVVDSELFKDSYRRWMVQRDLSDGFSDGGHIVLLGLKIDECGGYHSDKSHFLKH